MRGAALVSEGSRDVIEIVGVTDGHQGVRVAGVALFHGHESIVAGTMIETATRGE
jgi:hypothetical protein